MKATQHPFMQNHSLLTWTCSVTGRTLHEAVRCSLPHLQAHTRRAATGSDAAAIAEFRAMLARRKRDDRRRKAARNRNEEILLGL